MAKPWRNLLKVQLEGKMPIEAPEVEIVRTTRVACSGGGALGHPLVWYSIPADTGWVECGYCDKRFVLERNESQDETG